MPGPDPTAVWIEEGWNGRLTATYEVFLATNLSARGSDAPWPSCATCSVAAGSIAGALSPCRTSGVRTRVSVARVAAKRLRGSGGAGLGGSDQS